jgi:molecular chaperone DnaJ
VAVPAAGPATGKDPGEPAASPSTEDVFRNIFGDAMGTPPSGRRGTSERGSDLRYDMPITLAEAYTGKSMQIRVPTSIVCDACAGSGGQLGSRAVVEACATCQGTGKEKSKQGFFEVQRTCRTCEGHGEIIENACASCNGSGRVQGDRNLSVNIPAGIEDGIRLRLAGEGEAGLRGGPAGDLYIFLSIEPHDIFKRDGNDLFCTLSVPASVLASGGNADVPVIDGQTLRIKVPAGTASGKQFRLRGKGMSILRSPERGDLYVDVVAS